LSKAFSKSILKKIPEVFDMCSIAAENVATPQELKTRSMNDFLPQPDMTSCKISFL
jgi:hypothetical protein